MLAVPAEPLILFESIAKQVLLNGLFMFGDIG